jgi:hypothetical protein
MDICFVVFVIAQPLLSEQLRATQKEIEMANTEALEELLEIMSNIPVESVAVDNAIDKGWIVDATLELASMKAEIEEVHKIAKQWCELASEMIAELRQDYIPGELEEKDAVKAIQKIRKELSISKSFIRSLFDEYYPDMGDIDGETFQNIAENKEVLIPEIRYEPCGEFCVCATMCDGTEFLEGVKCYKLAEWLTKRV